ncbi:MAG: flagellar basal body P-ring formation chaperone FlgA [Proteobacteria bacterium]|nr:flagellar basal body P-ring formation chaperone FlgA [Pseudomonadota bacterium]
MAHFKHLLWLTALLSLEASAHAIQDTAQLRQLASAHVRSLIPGGDGKATLHAQAAALDTRLRLPACPAPEAFLPPGTSTAARMTVGVRCTNPFWTVYVPVTLETEMPVLVLRNAAAAGSALTSADVELRTQRLPGFTSRYVSDITALQGRHLKNAAGPGTALTTDLLVSDVLIKRGQRVTLVAAAGGLEVRVQGEAIADASPAGRVRVRNLDSQKVVEGQAESSDRVRLGM